jgi:hypothetical protein
MPKMDRFDVWDGVLLAIAAYVAVLSLVRMMSSHRRRVTSELEQQIQAEQQRRKQEEKRKKKPEKGRAA